MSSEVWSTVCLVESTFAQRPVCHTACFAQIPQNHLLTELIGPNAADASSDDDDGGDVVAQRYYTRRAAYLQAHEHRHASSSMFAQPALSQSAQYGSTFDVPS
ncbi:MAG: hypothetical protein HC869_06675 [Rhodospirillales bacterium]|nr:hypothetical protein [Rhodospirillales bacterium]